MYFYSFIIWNIIYVFLYDWLITTNFSVWRLVLVNQLYLHFLQCPSELISFVQKEQNVRMTFKWHIWLVTDSWSLTAPIRNSFRGRTEFCKITMTSGRRNLHFPAPNPLLIFYRQPPPWYKFLSLPGLQLPLKSKMAAMIFVKEILSSRSPKLRLLCRLTIARYWVLFFN